MDSSDAKLWRKAQQGAREKGCWVYVPRNALDLSLVPAPSVEPSESAVRGMEAGLFYKILPWGKNRVIVAFKRGGDK